MVKLLPLVCGALVLELCNGRMFVECAIPQCCFPIVLNSGHACVKFGSEACDPSFLGDPLCDPHANHKIDLYLRDYGCGKVRVIGKAQIRRQHLALAGSILLRSFLAEGIKPVVIDGTHSHDPVWD